MKVGMRAAPSSLLSTESWIGYTGWTLGLVASSGMQCERFWIM